MTTLASAERAVLDSTLADIDGLGPLDPVAMGTVRAHLDRLTKPPGSLGYLETLVVQLAGITGRLDAPVARRAIIVAAADHGVARRGVSAYPSEVTGQMVANFLAGGAAINVLAAQVGASLTIVDVGIASEIPGHGHGPGAGAVTIGAAGCRLVHARVRHGTADLSAGPAMSRDDALRAIAVGLDVVAEAGRSGLDVVGVGEMGIGNTTAASAFTAALTGAAPERVTGRGTGLDEAGWRRKVDVIEAALRTNGIGPDDPLGVLAAVGGLEIAALVGVILGSVAARRPVVLDGFITGAAALIAEALAPGVAPRLIAAHRSVEPGHELVLDRLGLRPLLELDLRLGEGTGAALALGVIAAAARLRDGMATFESAAITGPDEASR